MPGSVLEVTHRHCLIILLPYCLFPHQWLCLHPASVPKTYIVTGAELFLPQNYLLCCQQVTVTGRVIPFKFALRFCICSITASWLNSSISLTITPLRTPGCCPLVTGSLRWGHLSSVCLPEEARIPPTKGQIKTPYSAQASKPAKQENKLKGSAGHTNICPYYSRTP